MTSLRLATLSDIHAGQLEAQWTHVFTEPPAGRRGEHPLKDLIHFIEERAVKADYLIVPGDIANQGDAVGLAYGWQKIQLVATILGAELVAAPGNHDVVTHHATADARSILKTLAPSFPTGNRILDDSFWEHGWCVIEKADHRILIIDSTIDFPLFPNAVDKESPEWSDYLSALDRGTFTEKVEEGIDTYLRTASQKTNIAVIHHHPQEHQHKSYMKDAYGPMHRGDDLLDLLTRHPSIGRWILIHGHKHIPLLANAVTATSNGPIILCSASAGAQLWPPVNTITRNQFHVVNLTENSPHVPGTLQGIVESYTWGFGDGWNPSERTGSGLPAETGFGCAKEFRAVAHEIVAMMDREEFEFIRYNDLVSRVPELPYLLPLDMRFLEENLSTVGFEFSRNRQNKIVELYRLETM